MGDEIRVESESPLLELEGYMKVKGKGRGSEGYNYMKGEVVKSIVYAGLDAIVTCFSLISSISAIHLSSGNVLVLGIANLVADGISQGLGDFLSSGTKEDLTGKHRADTERDAHEHRRDQQQQLLWHYQNCGMDITDANTVVNIFVKYDDILFDQNMTALKGKLPPDQESEKPWKNGLITFMAFLVFGTVPLLSFIILKPFTDNDLAMFIGACFTSALALALLGIARARMAAKNCVLSVGTVLFNGAVAAAAAYSLGLMLRKVAGLEEPIKTKLEALI